MTSAHRHEGPSLPAPATAPPATDIAYEQGQTPPELLPISVQNADHLGALIDARLQAIDPMSASVEQSLDAMHAASLTTKLLIEAAQTDPEAFAFIGKPLDAMRRTARNIHQHQTGHPLPEVAERPSDADTALAALHAVKQKAEDRRWDGTMPERLYADANPTTADGRRTIAREAARGLKCIAEERGQAMVSTATAQELANLLKTR